MEEKYEKIISLSHHTSPIRRKMEITDRAAQFAPYAALVGFGDVVSEAARTTETRIDPDEQAAERIDRLLSYLAANAEVAVAEFVFFVEDERKSGGRYVTKKGTVKGIDLIARSIKFSDGYILPIDNIIDIRLS